MANEQRLGEFIDNLLDDLQSGAITAEEALAASSQYEYIRTLLSQRAQDLADATTEGDEALKSALVSIFSQTRSRLSELPAFASQNPDIVRDEKQTRDTATLEHFAFETLRKDAKERASNRRQTRQEFIHTLVTKYSSRANVGADEKAMDSVLDRALSKSSNEQSSQEAQQRFVKELSSELGVDGADLEKSIGSAGNKTIVGSWRDSRVEKEALTTLFTHPDLVRPDVVVDAFIHSSDQASLSDISAHSVKLAQTAGAMAALGTKIPSVKGPFFSNSNTKGVAKGVQQAADGILSLVGEPLREIILKEKINGTLRSVITNANQLADRLGEKFIHSSVFGFVTQNVFKGANEKPTMSQSTAIFGDVFGSVFRGPFDYATVQGAKDNLYDYLELARASSNAPKGLSFLKPNIMPWHLGSGLLPQKRRLGGGLPSLRLGVFGTLGGNALANMFDRFVGFAFAGPSIAGQLRASRRAALIPLPLSEDLPTLIAIFVLSVIIILFLFPSFLNIPQMSMAAKMSAILVSLQQGAQDVVCAVNDKNKLCQFESCTGDCSWPTTSGKIVQGPFTTCNPKDATHETVDGIDIVGTYLQPIYSVTAGTVITVAGGCADNTSPSGKSISMGCNKNYGNFVEIQTPDGVKLRYSHLSILFIDKISVGMSVQKGTIIGKMDNNGSSYSHHLHFEVRGNVKPSRLGKYLPISPSQMTELNGCVNNTGGCKACPNIAI